MLSVLASPTVHAVGSVTTSTLVAVAATSRYGDTGLSLGLVLLGAGIPSCVAIWLAGRAQKSAASTALAFATEAAERVDAARLAATQAAALAAEAVLTEAGNKAHVMLEAARLQAASVIATAVPVAVAVIDKAGIVAVTNDLEAHAEKNSSRIDALEAGAKLEPQTVTAPVIVLPEVKP